MATGDDGERCESCGYVAPVDGLADPAGLSLRRACAICRGLDLATGANDGATDEEARHAELLRAIAWVGNRVRADVRHAALADVVSMLEDFRPG